MTRPLAGDTQPMKTQPDTAHFRAYPHHDTALRNAVESLETVAQSLQIMQYRQSHPDIEKIADAVAEARLALRLLRLDLTPVNPEY